MVLPVLLVLASTCFEGTTGIGSRTRRVIVELDRPGAATIHLFTRPAKSMRVSSADPSRLSSSDGSMIVTFGLATAPVSAQLVMYTSRDTARATLRRVASPMDLSPVHGEWLAAVGPGGMIRLGTRLTAGPCGLVVGVFDSPDQGHTDLPLTAARATGDSLVLEAAYMGLRIALPIRGADVRRAMMTQHGSHAEIIMRRGALSTLERPQEPKRPFPYAEHDVRFPSRAPNVHLSGTLTVPSGPGPHPAVVFISGSGAQDRDETIAGQRPFLVLADRLTRLGYATLRTDDRGVAGTPGTPMQTGLHDVADDVRGATEYLRSRPEVDKMRIGLLGHSEGGFVAPIVAAGDSSIAFLLLLGAPAVPGRDVLTAQRSLLGRASGTPNIEITVDSLMLATIFSVLDTQPNEARLAAAVDSALTQWRTALPSAERKVADALLGARSSTQDSTSVELWKSRWFTSLYHHDPAPFLRSVRVPVFALIGELDLQVPAAQSAAGFDLLFASRRHLLTLHRLPGINHMLQSARTGRMEEYLEIRETIAPEVLARIDQWLTRVVPITSPPQ